MNLLNLLRAAQSVLCFFFIISLATMFQHKGNIQLSLITAFAKLRNILL